MIIRRLLAVICPAILYLTGAEIQGRDPSYGPESVVVVANKSMPASLKVAHAYMEMRKIPDHHLILVEAPTAEHISREVYLDKLHNPILTQLVERNLVNAFEGPVDNLGRKTASIFKNRIRYLVLCIGIPTKINKTPASEADKSYLKSYFSLSNPALIQNFSSGRLAKSEASVDGELSLLFERGVPLSGFVPNPLFGENDRDILTDVLRVTRLDGPSAEAVIRMLESSRKGEAKGLRGRAYVDEDGRAGGFKIGNTWMANTATLFRSMGFDTSHDTSRATFSEADRFDAPVLYAGWYAANCNGPFTLPGFRFPEGAVAAHLHSFSASRIRSTSKGWVGPFVDRGVACTFGNVAEPFLNLTHKFDAFFGALADGWNFADAAYYALPGLSWQGIAVGDPLYRPFAQTLEDQLQDVGDPQHIHNDQYLFIRQSNLLEISDKDGLLLLENLFDQAPGPALALAKARIYLKRDQFEEARASLAFLRNLTVHDPTEWGLMATIADELADLDDFPAALDIYSSLISQKMPKAVLLSFVNRGTKVAEKAGDFNLATKWRALAVPPSDAP